MLRVGAHTKRDLKFEFKDGKKIFPCDWPECGAELANRLSLRRHMNSHRGIKLYKCDWPGCERKFGRPTQLSDHMLWHNKDKKYACDWPGCQYRSYFCSNIRIHK